MIIENMPLLSEAMTITSGKVTIEMAQQLEAIEAKATGEEKALIGELWESLHLRADEETLLQLLDMEI